MRKGSPYVLVSRDGLRIFVPYFCLKWPPSGTVGMQQTAISMQRIFAVRTLDVGENDVCLDGGASVVPCCNILDYVYHQQDGLLNELGWDGDRKTRLQLSWSWFANSGMGCFL